MAVDLRQLECFIAVAEEGHVGRAAARLHMTQPPLTRRIARLETEIGVRLFERTPTGVDLTTAGVVLLDRAYRIVQVTSHAIDRARLAHSGQAGSLVVGYFGSMVFGVVPRLLRDFLQRRPLVDLSLERLTTDGQAEAIRNGRMHVGFSRRYPVEPGLSVHQLPGEALWAALPSGHRLSHAGELTLADLADEPLVLFPTAPRPGHAQAVVALFERSDTPLRVVREVADVVTALAYVATSDLCTVVLESATNVTVPGVEFVALAGVPAQPLSCLYRESPSPLVSAFLEHVRRPGSPSILH